MKRSITVGLASLGAGALLFALAAPAAAHITVDGAGATQGGSDQTITFRVPVEKKLPTVKLEVSLPTDHPIASVDVVPVAGWTHSEKITKLTAPIHTDDGDITEAVSQITWTATGGGLKPGEIGLFPIVAGLLPDVAELKFGAIQTYGDGSQVKWIESAAPGSTQEPDFPAPTLSLAPTASAGAATHSAKASTTGPTVLAIIALVVAAGALGLAVVSRARSRT